MAGRDPATNQLMNFAESIKVSYLKMYFCVHISRLDISILSVTQDQAIPTLTTSAGAPTGFKTASLTAGPRGPILIQDHVRTCLTFHMFYHLG